MLYCYVAEIAVSASARSMGIGAALLGAAEEWGRDQGAELAYLEYNGANRRAGLFYEREGYRVASITVVKRLRT
jgi:GNAT superfamily N-acetyltransferase